MSRTMAEVAEALRRGEVVPQGEQIQALAEEAAQAAALRRAIRRVDKGLQAMLSYYREQEDKCGKSEFPHEAIGGVSRMRDKVAAYEDAIKMLREEFGLEGNDA